MIEVNPNKRSCIFEGEEYFLTRKEFQVLDYLDKHRDRIVSSQELKDKIWEDRPVKKDVARTTLSRLTIKLGKPCYRVIYGDGYILL